MITSKLARFLALPVFLVAGSAQAAIIGGFNVDKYANTLDAITPSSAALDLVLTGGTLPGVITDQSVDTFLNLPGGATDPSVVLTLGFLAGDLVNGVGDDLVLFEIGTPDAFSLTINGTTLSVAMTLDTGDKITGGAQLNAIAIDLNDFGVAADAAISSIDVGLARGGASFALAGTLVAVPVPAAVWLFGSGLLGLVGVARRKK
ncbi:MAG: hypothetical protein BMS9Abin08_1398 [Gammaproteobacteria bacterium]|nr:MAG: hypothetical protein BMS9Abin08_1398 [Gammaproteobacteria bacterium]